MDLIPGHLRDRLGSCKVPLSYIIRDKVAPPALQPLQNDSCIGIGYDSLTDELVVRTPHIGSEYVEDNAKVFQIIQDMVQGDGILTRRGTNPGALTYCVSSKSDFSVYKPEIYSLFSAYGTRKDYF